MPFSNSKKRKNKGKGGSSKSSKRSNASAVTRSEARQIVKSTLKKMSTPKFFRTEHTGLQNLYPLPSLLGSALYVRGFAVGTNPVEAEKSGTTGLNYGTGTSTLSSAIKGLNHGRVFYKDWDNTTGLPAMPVLTKHEAAQVPDGDVVAPLFAKTKILIERIALNVNGCNPRELLPMYIRVVRVKIKETRNGANACQPQLDLFKDPWDEETGVQVSGFDKQDLVHFPVNAEKYTVLNDDKFTLQCPTMFSAPVVLGTYDPQIGTMKVVTGPPAGPTFKFLEYKHDLGDRLGYNFDEHNDPCTGMQQEYIFFHSYYIGDEPLEVTGAVKNSADKVRITVTPVSAFMDI